MPLEPCELHDVIDSCQHGAARDTKDGALEYDVLASRQLEMKARADRQHRQDLAADRQQAASWHHRPGQHLQEGGLPRAVDAHESQAFTLVDIERDVVERVDRALTDGLAAQPPRGRAAESEPLPESIRLPEMRRPYRNRAMGSVRCHRSSSPRVVRTPSTRGPPPPR